VAVQFHGKINQLSVEDSNRKLCKYPSYLLKLFS
jgi:hypothetical protein